MNIVKIMNNNVVSSLDEKNREIIVLGRGIGFKKKPGNSIQENLVEKIFRLSDEEQNQFEKLVKEIPYENMKLANEIIYYATEYLEKKLSKSIYITLTDHLNFAIERQKQGLIFQNALLWEIRKYYEKEFAVGLKAVEMVKNTTGIALVEDEAGFIALHILNAEIDGTISEAMSMPGMIKDILNIVKYTMGVEFDEASLTYERFITHLRFFVQRAVTKKYYNMGDDSEVFQQFIQKCPEEYACAQKIQAYMLKKTDYEVSDEEILYLTMHIYRVNRRN